MKLNGDLTVFGETEIKIKPNASYVFDSDDLGMLFMNNNSLYLNNGSAIVELSTTEFKTKLKASMGPWLNNDFSFNSLPFNNLNNISGLNAQSSLLNVIEQLDSAILKNFSATYPSTSTTHIIEHNLNTDVAHVTVVDLSNNSKLKPDIVFTDENTITINLGTAKAIKVLVSAV